MISLCDLADDSAEADVRRVSRGQRLDGRGPLGDAESSKDGIGRYLERKQGCLPFER